MIEERDRVGRVMQALKRPTSITYLSKREM